MKILLISPCINPEQKTPDGLMIPQLALHILEAMTPPEHEVKLAEEEFEEIDLDAECDLVGISCMTANAPRAYYLASEFRKRGKKVVLGGVHPTLLPEEASKFADSVVIGEAEGVWEKLLLDQDNGDMRKTYQCSSPSLDRYVPTRFKKSCAKGAFNAIPIMATRGCPYSCEFCCVFNLFGKKIRHVPVQNIVRNIGETKGKIYIFLDDNIIGNSAYAKELFRAIKPYGIKWVGQASLFFVHDTELMKLAADSGCAALFFGLESVSETQLKKMRKSIKEVAKIKEGIRKVKDLGIYFHASLIFGFDGDTKDTFHETLKFLEDEKIGAASFNILTPYPGTKVFEQFKSEGRLLTTDWKYYDHSTVVFRPKLMTPYELQSGEIWVKKEFSKISSIIRRLPGNLSHPLLYLALNFGIRKNVKSDEKRLPTLMSEIFALEKNMPDYQGETGITESVI